MASNNNKTLQLHRPLGYTLAVSVVLLLLLLLAGEGLARIERVRKLLPPPTWGSENAEFEAEVRMADQAQAKAGKTDCILFGSSVLVSGVEVPTFIKAYRAATGKLINCFKFYTPGLPTYFAGSMAQFLATRYHPNLLIYGVNARDYPFVTHYGAVELANTPWYQYKQGDFNFFGWLTDHSLAFRYLLNARNWMKPVTTATAEPQTVKIDPFGPLQPEAEKSLIRVFSKYRVTPETLNGIDELGRVNAGETKIVVAEIPLNPTFVYFLPRGEQDMQLAHQTVQERVRADNLPFWTLDDLPPIPRDGWLDRIHLKGEGTMIYSRWLGMRLGQAVKRGEIPDPILSQGK